ncbi:hypothetical protein [Thiomonas arsenitoxydans]|uniref:hypothetical protein n=1 Tax=Thiomonas arsenitoxydans (strain DSM 22701 / CIP 110005 / 3As) TaxID=426114 RepID=UPI001AC54665|nr:hypothetical protein [Thiomonas arsenitoxydans]MBN8775941.1 hypothetical protein [Thiomonas arsenitoxydans]
MQTTNSHTRLPHLFAKTLAAIALSTVVALPAAQADDSPLWSLAIGVPGLIANVGNAYPVAPQPVYVAPPVQYVPAPVYYAAPPPYYAPGPQYRGERRDHRHWDRHHGEDDRGGD